jgi:hypothetical protein
VLSSPEKEVRYGSTDHWDGEPSGYERQRYCAGNACLLKEEGTYSTIGDDDYTLPKTAKDMKGCLVELLSTISQIGTINKWKLSVVVSVQGQEDQTFSHDGTFASSGATVTDQIFVQLA